MSKPMNGKTVVITGANSGIGFCAARDLVGMGATVVMACRRLEAAEQAMNDIRASHPAASLAVVRLDVSSIASVNEASDELLSRFPRIDVLVNNAGIANLRRKESVDGFEMTFATNHLGPFLLTNRLLPALEAAQGRIVNVASVAHAGGTMHFDDLNLNRGYNVLKAYAQSKLANMLFTWELSKRLEGTGVTVNALHPGAVNTNIWPGDHWYERAMSWVIRRFTITPDEGSRTTVWLASSDEVAGESGGYYQDCRPQKRRSTARDDQAAERLWRLSADWVGLSEDGG
ncbi:NAD(P)-dependent dehydrogenase (short-subunit alcohol dehydrogenase family) [Tamilnaduibacter salinus]|uniref:NAD(P)-dependent dehydrogenase (Short-subunit alcohol dehydrogenase family) n=1 Tax=Tamilnaduibacter salinus TaxID=1484056 RepID=A0A2U1D1E7_9GAMM|nr:SDR family oxidoreductase [Tamilnaduibacter salinus]PVY79194.1 NAD(P)-dependent dehydrogenase (short-subunit alcohol dehydrogenase family) [Tamilnaduibacter salinus]